ncbi:hypothetical protein H1V43_40295 [Streptomyces sp. PSKA54]|uniref:RsbT co-antagonist protein RsbRD N-terminal domain-containing protein n=1 Tax=Streptomyces himalayensis subsp. aureolus TaxID=2758039 RepID=A0A7W2D9T3_9ACTN|nr:hypothetical protein [Streptomyces himalayensis]MBA4867396.1 hypothetical protein [Streptomyces himalayensis subsp. aureolus]
MFDVEENITASLQARTAEIARVTDARIREELPSYVDIPFADIERSIHANVELAIATLLRGSVPATESIKAAEASSTERVNQGVPIFDVMRGFRIGIRAIQEELVDLRAVP